MSQTPRYALHSMLLRCVQLSRVLSSQSIVARWQAWKHGSLCEITDGEWNLSEYCSMFPLYRCPEQNDVGVAFNEHVKSCWMLLDQVLDGGLKVGAVRESEIFIFLLCQPISIEFISSPHHNWIYSDPSQIEFIVQPNRNKHEPPSPKIDLHQNPLPN